MSNAVYRQGDVLLRAIENIPQKATKISDDSRGYVVLAEGEATGHFHGLRIADNVALFREDGSGGGLFLSVSGDAPAPLTHQEHYTIMVPPGAYEVRRQKEYAPAAIRNVED